MSYADKLFIDMCSDIIENGYSTEGEKVRPKWPERIYVFRSVIAGNSLERS